MFQNNDHIKTILIKAFQIFSLLSSLPMDGKGENRLKLENTTPAKITKNLKKLAKLFQVLMSPKSYGWYGAHSLVTFV